MPKTAKLRKPPNQERIDLVETADEAKQHRHHFTLYPKFWTDFNDPTVLKWHVVPFDEAQRTNIPQVQGVYAFIVKPAASASLQPSYLLYIGETTGQTLRERFNQYVRGIANLEERPKLITTLPKYEGFVYFHFAEVPPGGPTPVDIENNLLSGFVPPLNTKFSGIVSKVVSAFT
ncbi:MAG: hypothetical protein SFY67_04310 [Candidatus Melainabacteria bacterium]|nr:hypothetical protein [Candidatus Melainabacteria bacterium]